MEQLLEKTVKKIKIINIKTIEKITIMVEIIWKKIKIKIIKNKKIKIIKRKTIIIGF